MPATGQEIVSATAAVIALAIVLVPAIAPRAPAIVPRVLLRVVASAPRLPRVVAIAWPQPIGIEGPLPVAAAAAATTHSQAHRQGARPTWHLRAAR